MPHITSTANQGGSVGPEIEQCHTSHPLQHQGGSVDSEIKQCHTSHPLPHQGGSVGPEIEQCHTSHPLPHQEGSVGPETEQCHTSHPLPHQGGSIHCTCGVGRFQESSRLCSLSLRLIVKPPTAAWLCPSNVGPLTANSRPPEKTNHSCSLRLKRNIMQNKHLHNWLADHHALLFTARSVYTIQPCTMPHHFMQSHKHKVHVCLVATACMFSCNLPPALLAEWPGSYTCYCGNTGVEWIPK